MFLRLGTDSGRWKVNLNEVSYFKMSGAGKMDLPDGSPRPLADNAVGNRQRQVNRQRGVLNAVCGQKNPYQRKSWLVLSEFECNEPRNAVQQKHTRYCTFPISPFLNFLNH
jgi:hypothetical protein